MESVSLILTQRARNAFISQINAKNYSWPGDIRQLSNMIEQHIILGSLRISLPELENIEIRKMPNQVGDFKLKNNCMNDEQGLILEALKKTNGKVGEKDGAAILLGMKRTSLL